MGEQPFVDNFNGKAANTDRVSTKVGIKYSTFTIEFKILGRYPDLNLSSYMVYLKMIKI